MSEIEEMIQPQENDSSNPDELDVINVEETPISNGEKLQQMAEIVRYYRERNTESEGIKTVSAALTGIFCVIMVICYLMGEDVKAAESMIGALVGGVATGFSYFNNNSWKAEFERAQRNYEKLITKMENGKDSDQKGRVK